MKVVITPDKTQRIVLTKSMRDAAGIATGEKLEVTAQPGLIIIAPIGFSDGKIVKKGKTKVFTGDIPDVDGAAAVNAVRHYNR